MTLYKWSQTASADATADSTINWAEGQAPSSVNDSARAMMAATAKYRDDIAGAIVTTGTSTAYAVLSYQGFDTLAHLSGQMIAFTPHATNAATVTLNVDTLGPKPLRTAPGAELASGVIIQGTPYIALYNNTDGAFYLQGMFGNPYSIPIAGGLDYWGSTAPNSSFAFPVGQTISRTTYATLFALIATTYGSGDGTTTFNLPDKRGRVSAALDPTGNVLTSATVSNGNSLGGAGGTQQSQLTTANLPAYTPSGSVSVSTNSTVGNVQINNNGAVVVNQGSSFTVPNQNNSTVSSSGSGSFSGSAQGGTSASFSNVQPTIVCNYILRII